MPMPTEEIRRTTPPSEAIPVDARRSTSRSSLNSIAGRTPAFILAIVGAYAIVRSICLALVKPLWFDEISTSILVHQPSLSSLWTAFWRGADSQPLPFYLIERFADALIPNENLALRGVPILAFACVLVSLFVAHRKRCGDLNALLGAVIPLVSVLFSVFSVEARGYSLVLAFLAFALVCYQRTPQPRWVILLGISLMLAASSHYYAVIAFLPFLAAEAVLFLQTRRMRWRVWLALACGFIPFVISWPMLSRTKAYYGDTIWAKPDLQETVSDFGWYFQTTLEWGIALVAMAAIALLVAMLVTERRRKSGDGSPADVPLHECVLALGLLSFPFTAFAITKLTHGSMTGRYALPTVLGFALAAGYTLTVLRKKYVIVSVLLAVAVLVVVVPQERQFWLSYQPRFVPPTDFVEKLVNAGGYPDLPVVVSDQLDYLQLEHYATPEWKRRFVSVVDPPKAVEFMGNDSVDKNLMILRDFAPLQVYAFQSFAAEHPVFLLYSSNGGLGRDWWPARLKKDGYTLKNVSVRPRETNDYLHRVVLVSRRPVNGRIP